MPFTLAHPAAAVPLARHMPRLGVLSALVIGSMTPDFVYFLPLGLVNTPWGLLPPPVTRSESHSMAGLFWFCAPYGLAVFLVFHLFVKRPVVELLPDFIALRVAKLVQPSRFPITSYDSLVAVLVSLFVGALTHIVWDLFTHAGSPLVEAIAPLRRRLFFVWGYPVFLHGVLQLLSTLLGMALLSWWSWRWLRRTTPCEDHPFHFSKATRVCSVGILLGVALAVAVDTALGLLAGPIDGVKVHHAIVRALVEGMTALCAGVLAFSLVWHVRPLSGGPGGSHPKERHCPPRTTASGS